MALTSKQEAFVEEYLVDLNATQAAIRAGYSAKNADKIASELLGKTGVAAAVQAKMDARSQKTAITAEKVLQKWWDIANADPNELIQFRRTCCRYCHGVDHQYQWRDENEFAAALAFAVAKNKKSQKKAKLPSDAGGYGFKKTLDPVATCTNCDGEGIADIHGLDTRNLSPQARLLYAGAKVTQGGFEIKLRDQDKALENVAKHLGMFLERHMHMGHDGGAIAHKIELVGVSSDNRKN